MRLQVDNEPSCLSLRLSHCSSASTSASSSSYTHTHTHTPYLTQSLSPSPTLGCVPNSLQTWSWLWVSLSSSSLNQTPLTLIIPHSLLVHLSTCTTPWPSFLLTPLFSKKNIFGLSAPIDIDIHFNGQEQRKQIEAKVDKDKREKYPLYFDGETVAGKVNQERKKKNEKKKRTRTCLPMSLLCHSYLAHHLELLHAMQKYTACRRLASSIFKYWYEKLTDTILCPFSIARSISGLGTTRRSSTTASRSNSLEA